MRLSHYFTPVIGDINFLSPFFDDLLPAQSRAQIPQLPDAASADEDALAEVSEFVFATMHGGDDARDHNVAGGKLGSGMSDVILPVRGDFSGVSVDAEEFVFARPDGSGGGGDGGKPPKDGGDGDTGGLLTSYTSGGNAKTSYNITVNFDADGWSTALQQVFIDAAEYLSTIILGDISDERVPLFGRVDDLAIDASIIEMDGEGGILGGAAVFASRVGSELPAASIMQFDVADVGQALAAGYLEHIVVHEMVHAMGFGGKWADMGLVQTFREVDASNVEQEVLRFTGENATAEYNKLAIADDDPHSANGVLVEMDGGAGTEFVHWDDATFADLLMTGFIETSAPSEAILSTMSIAALEDMGYDTIYVPTLDDGLFA